MKVYKKQHSERGPVEQKKEVKTKDNKKDDKIEAMTFKAVKRLLNKKVKNRRAYEWVRMEMQRRGITKPPKFL